MRKILPLLTLVLVASTGAQAASTTNNWKLCSAATDAKNYQAGDLWALVAAQGSDGWLYGVQSFKPYDEPQPFLAELKRFSAALKARGTDLVMVYIPPRAASSSRHFDSTNPVFSAVDTNKLATSYSSFVKQINSAGIYSPDLLALQKSDKSEDDYFFARDHHWTPHAAQMTAHNITSYLKTRGTWSQLPTASFKLQEKSMQNWGSYLTRVNTLCNLNIQPQNYQSLISVKEGEDLLGGEDPKVVLVGTSNSFRNKGAEESFGAALRYEMQRDVTNAGIEGGGPYSSIESYLLSDSFRTNPAKVLIWEMDSSYNLHYSLPQLIPSVKGSCKAPVQRLDGLPSQIRVTAPLRPNDYLMVSLSDSSIRSVPLQVTNASGSTSTMTLTHTPKSTAGPIFYGEVQTDVKEVKLSLPDSTGKVRIDVCRG